MRESLKTLREGYLNFDKLYEFSAAIADDPATCAKKLNYLRERLGITEFALWTNIGGMPAADSMAAMRLIMTEIAPSVNNMEDKAKVRWTFIFYGFIYKNVISNTRDVFCVTPFEKVILRRPLLKQPKTQESYSLVK